jgi:fermentation-respiration switch protein FrsA (DUF1100 family)
LAAFAAVNAVGGWVGAVGLAFGFIDLDDRLDGRLPFDSPVIGGIALAALVATPLTVLAWSAWTAGPRTDDIALLVGVLLIGWIAVQVVVLWALSPLQPVYLCIGAWFVAASGRVHVGRRGRGVALVATGSIVAAIGVGLFPHLVEDGLSSASVVALTALLVGLAAVVAGGRDLLRAHPRSIRLAGGAGVALVLAFVVWLVAPAVAATHVPATQVTATPASRGLDYRSVTLATADGVELAAWYVPGTSGAGVVVMHGAGSTRSDVLDQASVLVGGGYAVLMVEARGHGESGGRAMDFGWYGDLDVAAGAAYLAGPAGVDAQRIGVVGLSMGGEEAIGAAAADPLIGAVVAEGATGRMATDKAWLSDVYGWRGWAQEQIEKVQFGVVDLLTDAGPPTALSAAVTDASSTPFLLITAGGVADEGHAAEFLRAAAPDRVVVWEVDGAGHTRGLTERPDEWERRVIGFLDEHLGRS